MTERQLILQTFLATLYELQWYRQHCIAVLTDEEYYSDALRVTCTKVCRRESV